MSLQLDPEVEAAVRQHAELEGITVDELLIRAFPPVEAPKRHRITTLLREWQREHGLPSNPTGQTTASVAEIVSQWQIEDERRTPEEIEAEQQLWVDLAQSHMRVEI